MPPAMTPFAGALKRAVLVLAAIAASGCTDPAVPDLNNPSLEDIVENPTRAQVQSMATGLLIGNRTALGPQVRDLEIIGRDLYNLDAADPRWVTELLVELDPGGFGGNHWAGRYRTIKGANLMIQAVGTAAALSAAEQSAARGFALTIKGLELLSLVETRDVSGVAADAGASTDELSPLLCRPSALTRVIAVLDEGNTALAAGGDAFPFVLPQGLGDFDTPATFARFNRALKAKAELYVGPSDVTAYGRALTALQASFVDSTASLDLGVYHDFSLAAGDATNPLYQDPATTNFRAHPSVITDAEAGDQRVAAKTEIGTRKEYQGVASNVIFTVYDSPTSQLPLLRNEELLLLRAQANLGAGNLAAAQRDLNTVRVKSGGLAPRIYTSIAEATDDLLRQKRYSLLFESGSRWVDARLFGRLASLPLDAPSHKVHPYYAIPTNEQLARGSAACTQ